MSDLSQAAANFELADDETINYWSSLPFILMHLLPFIAIYTGVSWGDVAIFMVLYWVRMFFITGVYHRYFAHRTYKTNRFFQFLLALGGTTCAQKGPLWWAGHHRHHHRYSDKPEDIHSPKRGFWWSHIGWILCDKYKDTPTDLIEDFAKYPEIRWLNTYHLIPTIALGVVSFLIGGASGLFFGFFGSTAVLYHCTFTINSLSHVIGSRRYATTDTSRNNAFLAFITLGEGWHNNHHHFQSATRNGFYWWEYDITYYTIRLFALVGLVSDLREPPESLLNMNRVKDGHFDVGLFEAAWTRARAGLRVTQRQVSGFCNAQRQSIEDFLEETRQRGEEALALALEDRGGEEAEEASALDEYLAGARLSMDQLAASVSDRTREFCEVRADSINRFLDNAQRQAGEIYDAKAKSLQEGLDTLAKHREDMKARIRAASAELAKHLAELEKRAEAEPA